MKRNQAFPSNFLGKDDVGADTLAAVIDAVRLEPVKTEHGQEDKPVMTVRPADQMKPLILNNVNWQTLEHAYGEDSDQWHGQPVEMFVDPSVMFGRDRVGGIRLCIPADARSAGPAGPGPRRTGRIGAPPPAHATAQHNALLDDMDRAETSAELDAVARQRKKIPGTTAAEDDEAARVYRYNLERVALLSAPTAPRRPTRPTT